jgi:hypothetical protein
MAIQLNNRDYQIFKLLEEHQVLLEKHISWFVAPDNKPVLIRDRLRKLFYLDYLICQKHDNKLPWWTTPTKPLVYMLAPLARTISGAGENQTDIYNHDWQRNHLEIANIRMIFLIAQKEKHLETFVWQTCQNASNQIYNAIITSTSEIAKYNIGLISHPQVGDKLLQCLAQELNSSTMSHIMIVSRDQTHQENLQKTLSQLHSHSNVNSILFTTHQDLYKSGLAKAHWHDISGKQIGFSEISSLSNTDPAFGTIEAA